MALRLIGLSLVLSASLVTTAFAQPAPVVVEGRADYLGGLIWGPRCREARPRRVRVCVYDAQLRLRPGPTATITLHGPEPPDDPSYTHHRFVAFASPHEALRQRTGFAPDEVVTVRVRVGMEMRVGRVTLSPRRVRHMVFTGLTDPDSPLRPAEVGRATILQCPGCTTRGRTDVDIRLRTGERVAVGGESVGDAGPTRVEGAVAAAPIAIEVSRAGRWPRTEPFSLAGLSVSLGVGGADPLGIFWLRVGAHLTIFDYVAIIPSFETNFESYVAESLMLEVSTPAVDIGFTSHLAVGVVVHQLGERHLQAGLRVRPSLQFLGAFGWSVALEYWPADRGFAIRGGLLVSL